MHVVYGTEHASFAMQITLRLRHFRRPGLSGGLTLGLTLTTTRLYGDTKEHRIRRLTSPIPSPSRYPAPAFTLYP